MATITAQPDSGTSRVLITGGAFSAASGFIGGLIVLFLLPSACSVVSGLLLLFAGTFFVLGVVVLLIGLFIRHWHN